MYWACVDFNGMVFSTYILICFVKMSRVLHIVLVAVDQLKACT